ncbi:MAG TPA: 2-hydroxyacid dehydrogenase [Burkholderiales bacterium]|nr:2-hydroxyacid dehydrogenase [Burkholderiales bacterium]
MKPEILVMAPIYAPVLAQLEREYTVSKLWEAKHAERYLGEQCGEVRAVITTALRGLRATVIDQLPQLELIACFGNPRGTIDRDAVARRGITVASTPDDITATVGELAAGMAITLMRRICESDRFVRSGQWLQRAPAAGTTLVGKTCGIVGLGRIGRETAARLEAFGMTISYHGPRAKPDVEYRYFADVQSLARAADCLVVSCPETPQSRNLIDTQVLDALGPDGFLVNVARGPIVDEAALIAALKAKRIAGAALDVYWNEPRVPDALIAMENVVLLPHIGSATREVREERGRKLMANLRAHFARQPVPHPLEI